MYKTFRLERRVHHLQGYGAITCYKMSVWRPRIDLFHVEQQVLLQFGPVFLMLQPKRCSLLLQNPKGKCWRTSWIERYTGVITQRHGKLWWFNSHANYLNQCTKCHCFSKKQHTLHTQAHTRSKQKLHTHNYKPPLPDTAPCFPDNQTKIG